jgi:hypothetical protein
MERNALLLDVSTRGLVRAVGLPAQPGTRPRRPARKLALAAGGGRCGHHRGRRADDLRDGRGLSQCELLALLPGGYGGLELDDERAASVGCGWGVRAEPDDAVAFRVRERKSVVDCVIGSLAGTALAQPPNRPVLPEWR